MKYIKIYEEFKNNDSKFKKNESFGRKMYDLINYFNKSIEEKIDELPVFFQNNYPEILYNWCSDNIHFFIDDIENDDEIILPEDVMTLYQYPEAYEEYCEFLYKISTNIMEILNDNEYNLNAHILPLFVTYTYESDVKDGWLVHFTSDLETVKNILEDKHFNGIPDIKNLAITAGNEDDWVEDGYCFAYDIYDTYYNFKYKNVKYGDVGVIFKSSGIKLYHAGDEEHQVVFIGNTAKNMVGFYKDKDGIFYTIDKKISDINFDIFKEKVVNMFE